MPTPAQRKIGTEHFAFYRGWIEGLDLADLGERYLVSGRDRPQAKRTLRWLQDELIAAARRKKPALARLLRLSPQQLSHADASATPGMTLAAFQQQVDPGGFYTEAELIALFETEHAAGADPLAERRARRNARLIKRLRDAVSWLEGWVAAAPVLSDPVEVWFDPAIAARLCRAQVTDLAQLVSLLKRYGASWHRQVPRVGVVAAQRIQHWLAHNGLLATDSLPSARVLASAPRLYVAGIVPIERLLLPAELSGALASNRGSASGLAANDDLAAIQAWLNSLRPTVHTLRNYRGQAERFLLWMLFERGKALSAATVEDCTGYRDFLDALDPASGQPWCGYLPRECWLNPKRAPRWRDDWRPFAGALSPTSQRQALTILSALFDWLTAQRYLLTNPWRAVSPIHRLRPEIRADHSLSLGQWQAVLAAAHTLPRGEAYFRLRLALLLAYGLGLRLAEITAARVAAAERPGHANPGLKAAPDGDGWVLTVAGKGGYLRDVPVPGAVLAALADYGEAIGLGRDLAAWPAAQPLFQTLGDGSWRAAKRQGYARQAMSTSQMYRLFKYHFEWAASTLSGQDRRHLASASTHWLRHTHATHALEAGAQLVEVQENLGHSSIAVTAIYTHASHKRKKAAIDKLMAFASRQEP